MPHGLIVFDFVLICSVCACFAALLVTLALAQRANKAVALPPGWWAYSTLTLAGTLLLSVSSYWRAFGAPPHHPDLPDILKLGGLGVMVAALVVNRKQLGPALALLRHDPFLIQRLRDARREQGPPP